VLTGGKRAKLDGKLAKGCYVEPTIFEGHNKMRVFQEDLRADRFGHEIQGPLAGEWARPRTVQAC